MKKLLSLFSALTLLLNTFLFIFAPLAVAQEPAKYINFEQLDYLCTCLPVYFYFMCAFKYFPV